MLDLKRLAEELEAHRDDIARRDEEADSLLAQYRSRLPLIDSLDAGSNAMLPRYSGCKVLEEGPLVRRFRPQFGDRGEATDWALETLRGKLLAAVDGSQVFPSPQVSIPVGLVQACTVLNRHTGKKGHSTTARLRLLVPGDFEGNGTYAYDPSPVSLKRFEMECGQIVEFMDDHPGDLIFFDGSLVLSFIAQMAEAMQKKYASALVSVLEASERTRTPVAAYTDMSLSMDLVTMMRHSFRLPRTVRLADAHLLHGALRWGDRTRAFSSDRDDRLATGQPSVLDRYGPHRDSVAFFYIQASGGLPSKVELPAWCHEQGMVDRIADVIRAQCIVRPGYPDILLRAHEHASITYAETEIFEGMLEVFARRHNVNIYKSAKAFNKQLGA